MQQQITRGDYLEDLITIYIENNLQQDLNELYSMFVFQCGEIQKQLTPASVIKISFTEQESQLLTNYNTCYLAGITTDGHKETFNGSISFNTRGEVVYYEPTPNSSLQASMTSTIACPCTGISGVFANCTQPAIKAYFSINYVPTKLSELQNDTDFQDSVDVAESISIHNALTEAHPYIQDLIATEASLRNSQTEALGIRIDEETSLRASQTQALYGSIQAEATARDEAISAAISTTEAYADSVLQSATTAINTTIGDLSQLDTSVKSSVTNAINSEVSARQSADNNLQGQIDGLAAASDVTDIVGTYAELQSYDTQHLNDNDIIKVLSDETHDDEPSYYRFNKTAGTFSYIGSESAAYTKAQSNSIFVAQTTTVNGKALSSDISLTYSDVSALPATTQTVIDAHTSAIASNTSTLATHTTAIATNTSDISTINGKIPSNASSSNKMAVASDIAAINTALTLKADKTQLHALKGYADEGELLQDADGLSFVKNYAHSTFDLSKFTVVGSPNITDDGIASGFSLNNYIRTIKCNELKDKSWEITERVLNPINIVRGFCFNQYDTMGCINFGVEAGNCVIRFLGRFGDTTESTAENVGMNSVNVGRDFTFLDIKLTFDLSTGVYNLYYKKDGLGTWTFANTYTPTTTNKQLYSIYVTGNEYIIPSYYRISGYDVKTDLKQFSITVDGVEVFSGNKTGIDTIKPDNYTVVGTPTISADGVASGFSSGNYLTASAFDFSSGNVNIYIDIGNITSQSGVINLIQLSNETIGWSTPAIRVTDDWAHWKFIISDGTNTVTADAGTDYRVKPVSLHLYIKDRKIGGTVNYGDNNRNIPETDISTIDLSKLTGLILKLGTNSNISSIDLNAFKIFVDGNLVYQPCLKIPYTESKTGSKIVDSIYRDRVNDMAEQFGYANYYTLSDTDFTLPQVELYGLIGQRTLRDSYRNGINYWELYSNRDLEQGGSCTSGVEVTFARPFADTNYVLSVPYSAKSSTAFTPTQTGDWIAKGKGLL